MDFVSFELAKKLKEKGFEIPTRSIVAMYNEQGVFFTLTTAADYQVSPSGYKCRCYYDYDDFDEHDYIAPTISQVLKWLRKEKKIYVVPLICSDWSEDADGIICEEWLFWSYRVINVNDGRIVYDELDKIDNGNFEDYEQAALEGIEYVIDNLI